MNILIVHNYYQIPGGEDTVVSNEISLLKAHGHNVVFYSKSNSELINQKWYQKIGSVFSSFFNFRVYFEIRKIIKVNNIDVVHVHNTTAIISPSVFYAAKTRKTPIVQTIHNFRMLCPAATFYRKGKICEDCLTKGLRCSVKNKCYHDSLLQTFLMVTNLRLQRFFQIYKHLNYICLTEFTKNKIMRIKQINPNRIFIKPNFVPDCGCRAEVGDYFIFVGRLEENKGVNFLLDVFEKNVSIKLKIVGTGSEYNKVLNRIKSNKMNNVEMLGYKSGTELMSLISRSLALIMCSQWYETFGMVIAEAYSNGVPVIAGDIGNVKTLVVDKKTGRLFKYNSEFELDAILKNFTVQQSLEYGRNAYVFYKSNLSENSNYQQLMEIYEKVTNP